LALLEEARRPTILSIPNVKYARPRLWSWMTCLQIRRRIWKLRKRRKLLFAFLVPVCTFLQVVTFMAVLYPSAFLVWLFAPVQMSRIMVFLTAILCILWSVLFVVETAVDTQPYAILWGAVDEQDFTSSCICHCEYVLNHSVVLRVFVLGAGVAWHSFSIGFRALRGLRRAQWANMFTVLYAIPIEAFPIIWQRPNEAGPIRFRSEGEPMQSEPAFDPFALMDEQPESAWTRPQIKPVVWSEQQQFVWEPYAGTLDSEIGCCGFPRPAAVQGEWQEEDEDDSDGDEDNGTQPGAAVDSELAPAREKRRPSGLDTMQQELDNFVSSWQNSPLGWAGFGGSAPSSRKGSVHALPPLGETPPRGDTQSPPENSYRANRAEEGLQGSSVVARGADAGEHAGGGDEEDGRGGERTPSLTLRGLALSWEASRSSIPSPGAPARSTSRASLPSPGGEPMPRVVGAYSSSSSSRCGGGGAE